MIRFIIWRILQCVPVGLGISMLTFFMLSLVPGDPVSLMLGQHVSPQIMNDVRQELGLDLPFFSRYFQYIWNILHGDLGRSYIQHQDVTTMLLDKIPITFNLTLVAMTFAITAGVLIGVLSAVKQGSPWDTFTTGFTLLGISVPSFWLGMILQLIFGVILRILPVSGSGGEGFHLQYYILPGFTLGFASMAMYAGLTRSGMLEVLGQDYIRTARAKGLSKPVVVLKHGLKNALIPVTTHAGMDFASLMGGTVLTEMIFSLPGIGTMLINAVSRRDYPVVQGVTLFLALVFVLVNLLVDIIYAVLDPRIRYD